MRKLAVLALALIVVIPLASCKTGDGDAETTPEDTSYTIETTTAPISTTEQETTTEPPATEPPESTTAPNTQDPSSISFTPVDQTVYAIGENVT